MTPISKDSSAEGFFELMTRHLQAVTIELFGAYDIPLRPSRSTSIGSSHGEIVGAATIGFAGEKVRGALTLVGSMDTVQSWLGVSAEHEWDLGDVLREYANMLLGRLKGRLLVEGLPILLATPTSVCGRELRLSVPPGRSSSLVFDGPAWQISVRINTSFEAGFCLLDTPSERPAEAGAAIFF